MGVQARFAMLLLAWIGRGWAWVPDPPCILRRAEAQLLPLVKTNSLGHPQWSRGNFGAKLKALATPPGLARQGSIVVTSRRKVHTAGKRGIQGSAEPLRRRNTVLLSRASETDKTDEEREDTDLPPTVLPICLSVLVQMLGEGIAIASIPLHLKGFGATAVQIGVATSAFSFAQMICCPLLVKFSSRVGRTIVLRLCLLGATMSSFIIAFSPNTIGVICGRFLAGAFAASVPVAQAGVTDLVSGPKSALALSRVATASQLGLVGGPAMSAALLSVIGMTGLAEHLQMRAIFFMSGLFALGVLAYDKLQQGLSTPIAEEKTDGEAQAVKKTKIGSASSFRRSELGEIEPHPYAQLILRAIALAMGWSLTISVLTYCLFGNAVQAYNQQQLSLTFSAGAATAVFTQFFVFPRLVRKLGDHATCSFGLLGTATGLLGCSTILMQPFHTGLYLLNRMCSSITDTATATLVAGASNGKDQRSQNLALIQSTRAGSRIVTPVLSGFLFQQAAALPYFTVAALSLILTPLPFVLKQHDERQQEALAAAEEKPAVVAKT